MVQQMAAKNFALRNGGQMPIQQPVVAPPVPQQPTGWNADGSANYDSLSNALSGYQYPSDNMAGKEFEKSDSDSDGGFASWVKKILPKKRPGRREGETDDEYDRRRTRNMEMVATLADAIRHMGNIINTSKGAPLQNFNDPTAMLEQGYQNRKAERAKKEALAADQAYKNANLSLKERAAKAEEDYKLFLAGLRRDGTQLNQDKFEYTKQKDADNAKYKAEKDKRDFEYKQDRDKVKDEQTNRRLSISEYNATHKGSGRSGRSGSGSGAKYWFEDKNGKMHYQPNKTMWEQEYYREYGKLPQGESSTSVTTKTTNYRTGEEKTTTTRTKGASVTSQAAQQQNAAKRARNKPKPTSKSKNGYKNTKKLGL